MLLVAVAVALATLTIVGTTIEWFAPAIFDRYTNAPADTISLGLTPTRWDWLTYSMSSATEPSAIAKFTARVSLSLSGGLGFLLGFALCWRQQISSIARRFARNPSCLKCRYSLAGIESDTGWATCPECARISPVSAPTIQSLYTWEAIRDTCSDWLRWSNLWRDILIALSLLVGSGAWIALCAFVWAIGEGTFWDLFGRLWSLGSPRASIFIPLVVMLPAIASGALAFHLTRRLLNR